MPRKRKRQPRSFASTTWPRCSSSAMYRRSTAPPRETAVLSSQRFASHQYRKVRDLAWGRSGDGEDFGCMIAESIISPCWFKYRP